MSNQRVLTREVGRETGEPHSSLAGASQGVNRGTALASAIAVSAPLTHHELVLGLLIGHGEPDQPTGGATGTTVT